MLFYIELYIKFIVYQYLYYEFHDQKSYRKLIFPLVIFLLLCAVIAPMVV